MHPNTTTHDSTTTTTTRKQAANDDNSTWEVNTVKSKRRRDKKGGGKSSAAGAGKKTSNNSFGGWAKPTAPKADTTNSRTPKEENENDALKNHINGETVINASTGTPSSPTGGFMMQPMSALLADYGEFDPHWMDKQPEMESDGQNAAAAEEDNATNDDTATKTTTTSNRLGQQGKAPLHIDIISFGFRYGAPSTRKDGWSQTQPLQPFDCRDVLPEVPGYLQFHDGLFSGQVKRFLLYDFRRQAYQNNRKTEQVEQEPGPSVREYSFDTVAPPIFEALLEAVRTGGYGYALPLKMQIYIGSEWGRHRSVVAVEQTAAALRKKLRNSKTDNGLECPCSVATQHRDIVRKLPSKKARDDE